MKKYIYNEKKKILLVLELGGLLPKLYGDLGLGRGAGQALGAGGGPQALGAQGAGRAGARAGRAGRAAGARRRWAGAQVLGCGRRARGVRGMGTVHAAMLPGLAAGPRGCALDALSLF